MSNKTILHINSSSRYQGSITREISASVVNNLSEQQKLIVVERDLAKGLPFIDAAWINANFTDNEQRNDKDKAVLAFSDELVNELKQAEHLVIASPVYNFCIPAVLKAWVDLIARARLTFKYSENGPVGLLTNTKATIVMASGGVPIDSDMDLATKYLKQVLAFIGITDVQVIDCSTFSAEQFKKLAETA